jgi:hypothetical protein
MDFEIERARRPVHILQLIAEKWVAGVKQQRRLVQLWARFRAAEPIASLPFD